MSLAATVDAMAEAGCTPQQIAAVVRAHCAAEDEKTAQRRAKDADRQRKSREARDAMSRDVTVTSCDTIGHPVTECDEAPAYSNNHARADGNRDLPSEDISLKTNSFGISKKPEAIVEILSAVVPEETARELIAHRRAIKSPLTAGAAKGLAKNLASYSDPKAGAEAMMANGWRGFKPEWMDNQARAGPRQERMNGPTAMMLEIMEKKREQRSEERGLGETIPLLPLREIDGGDGISSEGRGISGNAVSLLLENSFKRM